MRYRIAAASVVCALAQSMVTTANAADDTVPSTCEAPRVSRLAQEGVRGTTVKSDKKGQRTTVASDRGYTVSLCNASGKWIESKHAVAYGEKGKKAAYVTTEISTLRADGSIDYQAASLADPKGDIDKAMFKGTKMEAPEPSPGTPIPAPEGLTDLSLDDIQESEPGSPVTGATSQCVQTAYERSTYTGFANGALTYKVNGASLPGGDDNYRKAIVRAHHNWNNTYNSCGLADSNSIASVYGGITQTGYTDYPNGINASEFGTMSSIGYSNSAVLAVTRTLLKQDGSIGESDQRFNKTSYTPWSTSEGTVSNKFDLESIATHETGHSIGLRDLGDGIGFLDQGDSWSASQVGNMTMFYRAGTNDPRMRTLAKGDVLGMQFIYGPK